MIRKSRGHRLVVTKTKKVSEIQRDRPLRFGLRKTFKFQCGAALTTTVEEARARAIARLGQNTKGLGLQSAEGQAIATTPGSDLGPGTRKM
jgi:hypothetical protein